jgi:FRG domain-containing protein
VRKAKTNGDEGGRPTPTTMIEKELPDWPAIVGEFEGPQLAGDWLFRGEHDAKWTLKTTLERYTPPHVRLSRAEDKLLNEFRRRAHFYLAPQLIPESENAGEWLALMQHFGAPTRLLDVTRSPYLALYFAIEDNASVERSAVWAIERSWCLVAAGEAIFQADPKARDDIRRRIGPRGRYPTDTLEAMAQGVDSGRLQGDHWRHKATTVVVPFEPRKLSPRLSVQQGGFLVPRNLDLPFQQNLEALGNSGSYVIKYLVPHSERARILERLRIMNITREQLFPGLDGFAQSFQQFLFGETDEQRQRRIAQATLQVQANESVRSSSTVAASAADAQNRMNALLSFDPKPDGEPPTE